MQNERPDPYFCDPHFWASTEAAKKHRGQGRKSLMQCHSDLTPQLLTAARGHWSVENNLHWQLDISINKDACRVRQKNSTENLATVRYVALNILKTG
jgi:predicted transposase YbfD/YdcC